MDNEKYEEEFHKVGRDVVDRIRDWDRRLCSAMGKGTYSQYSQKLSEKFWDEARQVFPLIDRVGVRVKKLSKYIRELKRESPAQRRGFLEFDDLITDWGD